MRACALAGRQPSVPKVNQLLTRPRLTTLIKPPRAVAARCHSVALRVAASASESSERTPQQRTLLVLRRLALVAITLKVVLFTPWSELHKSALLGVFASVLASRDAMTSALPAVLGGKHLSTSGIALVGVALYLLAGLCEIGGGWLVWQAMRAGKPKWWAALGSLVLVAYGFVAALQPQAAFGRAFALYGGYFVVMSIAWGAVLDGFRPDKGDFVGCAIIVAGIIVMSAWPRASGGPG